MSPPTSQPRLFSDPTLGPTVLRPEVCLSSTKPRPCLKLCVLGSGSGGNSTVVRRNGSAMLIDAGFGPVTTTRRLRHAGMDLQDISAVILTHLDQDHFRPRWIATLLGWRIRLHVHRWHLDQLLRLPGADELHRQGLVGVFDSAGFSPFSGDADMLVEPVHLPHDDKGTFGFHLRCPEGRIGYATDLGHVPAELVERFAGVDLLAIESNYDPHLQRSSSRPAFLKQRIMGGQGHLSNQQAFETVRRVAELSEGNLPRWVVLLHRSAQCNDPAIVREVFARESRLTERVVLAEQRRRSRWFEITPRPEGERAQMELGF